MTGPGSAAPVFDPWAPLWRARALVRVGALEQQVPGWQVEAVQAPLIPPAVLVERDAPDEVSPAREARLVAALGQGRRCGLLMASALECLEPLVHLQGGLAGLLQLGVDDALLVGRLPRGVPWGARLLRGITVVERVHDKA